MSEGHIDSAVPELEGSVECESVVLRQQAGFLFETDKEQPSSWFNAICFENSLVAVRRYIQNGEDVNETLVCDKILNKPICSKNPSLICTPLILALWLRKEAIAETLIYAGSDVNAFDNLGFTPLHVASENDCVCVELLIKKGANVNAINHEGSTPLHMALSANNRNIADTLINAGADVNASDIYSFTPLHVASVKSCGSVEFLIEKGANVNAVDGEGSLPLHYALKWHNPKVAETFINAGADVNASDNNGFTPLHFASESGNGIIELLIGKGANANATDCKGSTPLHKASREKTPDVVESLINAGANVNATCREGSTPLHVAFLRQGHLKTVQTLIKAGADVNATNNDGSTSLHFWGKDLNIAGYLENEPKNSEEVLSCLIEAGAKVNVVNNYGDTPLHSLLRNDRVPYYKDSISDILLKAMIDEGMDISQTDKDRKTTLHLASQNLLPGVVKCLLENGASVKAVTNTKDTALHLATKSIKNYDTSETRAIEMLLLNGADINAVNSHGYTPLGNAKFNKNCRVVFAFIICWKLTKAATEGNKELFEFIQRICQVSDINWNWLMADHSYLQCAATNGQENIVEKLLEEGATVNAADPLGNTALHLACKNGHLGVVRLLLERGASRDILNTGGHSPLDLAKVHSYSNVVDLVEFVEWCQSHQDIGAFVSSLLPRITANDNYFQKTIDDLSRQLAEKEDECALLRREQETATLKIEDLLSKIDATATTGKLELETNAQALCQKNEKMDLLHSQMEQIMTAIGELKSANLSRTNESVAADEKETASIKSFFTNSFKSFTEGLKKKSSLLEAVTAGDEKLVVRLLKKNPDLNMRDKDQQTPLFIACKYNRYDIVRLLIARGANVDACNKDNATPLYIASENGYALAVDCLLENKANVNTTTRNGETPLLIAADNGHVVVVEALLNRGVLINKCKKGGYSPLYMAARNDRREVVHVLLEHGADVNAASEKKMSPLHRAAIEGHRKVVELLLEYGADTDALNSQQETPDASAEQHDHLKVRDLIVSWRQMSQSEQQRLAEENRSRRKVEKDILMRESMPGSCNNPAVLYQQLVAETLEAEELRKTLNGLKTKLNAIPEEDENLGGESVYDASAVAKRIDEVSGNLAAKDLRVAELQREIARGKRQRHEDGTNNYMFFKDCVFPGTVTGDIDTFIVGAGES